MITVAGLCFVPRVSVVLAAILALAAQGGAQPQGIAGQNPVAASADTGVKHLHGIVVDSHTGKPIARALVQAFGDRLATLTDHDGRFALDLGFTEPSSGQNSLRRGPQGSEVTYLGLTARKPGYVARPQSVNMVAASALEQDFTLKLTPESVIQGRIAASGDDHPENVRVSLLFRQNRQGFPQWNQVQTASTNSRGEFRFGGLQAGDYKLMTQVWTDGPGQPFFSDKPVFRYSPVSYPPDSAGASGPSLHVGAGETLQADLNLHAEMYYPVRIPVVTPGGSGGVAQETSSLAGVRSPMVLIGGIVGARVLRGGAAAGFFFTYNGREQAVEGMLPKGVYEIALESNGQPLFYANVPLTVGGSAVKTAPVTLLSALSIPVILHRDFTQQQDAGGSAAAPVPYRNLPLTLALIPEEANRPTPSLNTGGGDAETLTVDRVLPGVYRLQVSAGAGYVAAATSGGADLLRQPLIVGPAGGVAPIEITLRDDSSSVNGAIPPDASESTGPAPVYVACIPAEPTVERLQQGVVSPDGRFSFAGIPPGSYRIYASRQPFDSLDYRGEAFLQRNGTKGYPVTLAPGEAATVTLTAVLDEDP